MSERVEIEGSGVHIEVGLEKNGNYIEVWTRDGLEWKEGFHRETHNLTSHDVTGWNSGDSSCGVFFAVRYGRNRDLFQFYQLVINNADGHIDGKIGFFDSFSRDRFIELEWGFGPDKRYVCRTKPYGSGGYRWAYNFDPNSKQWSGFEL